jgi:hypothetical protein
MDNPFGQITTPEALSSISGGDTGGLQVILNIILRTMIMGAGIYAVINIILAGYAYLSASGDPKRISDATAKIWHSVLGFVIAAGAFVLAGLLGELLFGDPNAILQLRYFAAN